MKLRYLLLLAALLGGTAYAQTFQYPAATVTIHSSGGGGAPCSTIPAPSFVVGGTNNAGNNAITLAGLQVGDVIVGCTMGLTANPVFTAGWFFEQNPKQTGSPSMQSSIRTVAPGDGSTYNLPSASSGGYAAAAFRGISTVDGSVAGVSGSSTSPAAGSFTATNSGGIAINVIGWDVAGGTITYTASTGYTAGANQPAVFGSGFGCAVEYKLNVSSGTVGPPSGAVLSSSTNWAAMAMGLAKATITNP